MEILVGKEAGRDLLKGSRNQPAVPDQVDVLRPYAGSRNGRLCVSGSSYQRRWRGRGGAIVIGASTTHGFRPLYRARVCWGGGGGRTLFGGGLGSFCKAEVKELEPVLAPKDFTIQDIARNAKYASV